MIGNALSELHTELIKADVCIIGAGAAGITLALALAGTSLRVCVLESGGFEPDEMTQSLYEGENVGLDYFPLDATRLRYFGGTTGHWGGWCGPLDPIDFETRPWLPSSGWPFGLDELRPFYERAHEICEIDGTDYRPEFLEKQLGAERLPLDPAVFQTKVTRYSPPTRFGDKYRRTLRTASNVNVLLHANALQLQANETASRVQQIRCAKKNGVEFYVESRVYVLAAGGIENPRILLLSKEEQSSGLANTYGLVGRHFMDHPHRYGGVLVPEDPERDVTLYDSAQWRRKPGVRSSCFLAPTEQLQREARLLNGIIELTPRYAASDAGLGDDAEALLDRIGRVIRREGLIDYNTYHNFFQQQEPLSHFEIFCSWEQSPNASSRVGLSHERDFFGQNRVKLDWRIKPDDEEALQRTLELLGREFGKAGIGRLKIDIQIRDWPGGHHHMGTTRMHPNPRHGVVDADCRVHGLSNLYVAGSSVFPTSGAINPTLTIVALADRLANRLKSQLMS